MQIVQSVSDINAFYGWTVVSYLGSGRLASL